MTVRLAASSFRAESSRGILDLQWWLVATTLFAFLVNEAVGAVLIYLSVALWGIYVISHPADVWRALGNSAIVIWLVPVIAVASTTWSNDPSFTLKMSLELVLTATLAVLCARLIGPADLVNILAAAGLVILVASIFVGRTYYDGMTGTVSWAGIFANKNTLGNLSGVTCIAALSIAMRVNLVFSKRLAAALLAAFSLLMCLFARSVAAFAAAAAGIFWVLTISWAVRLPYRARSIYARTLLVVSGGGAGLLAILFVQFGDDILRFFNKDPTLTGRTILWFYADHFSKDHPLLGVGYQAFWIQGFSPAEYLWDRMRIPTRYGFHFHSLYYQTLIDLGYVGVCAAAIFISATVVGVGRWAIRSPDQNSGFYFAFVCFMLLQELQAVDLFLIFGPWYTVFIVGLCHSREHRRR